MRNSLFALVVLALSLPAFAADPTPVKLEAGKSTQLDVAGLSRLSVGDPLIADVKVLGGTTFEVDGLCPGTTGLRVWDEGGARYDFTIEVTGSAQDPAACAEKPASVAVVDARTVTLKVGEATSLSAPRLDKVIAGDTHVFQVRMEAGGKVRIEGTAPGKSSLLILRDGQQVGLWSIEVH